MKEKKRILDISEKTFFIATSVLVLFIAIAAVLTYIIPRGSFGLLPGGAVDYTNYIPEPEAGGIPIWKAVLSPVLIFLADGAIQPVMLMLFLLIIAGVFQVMSDCGAMEAIVGRIACRFQHRRKGFLAVIVLFFMMLGSLFGIFEESLIVLPMILSICARLGFDPLTGFAICTMATGFGFSAAITNPFSVVYASNLIGASISSGVGYRIFIFLAYYLLVMCFVLAGIPQTTRSQDASSILPQEDDARQRRIVLIYGVFLVCVVVSIVVISSISALRDISIALLAAVFLVGGVLSGILAAGPKETLKGFRTSAASALPAVGLVSLAFAVKYVLVEGRILDTITNEIGHMVAGKSPYVTVVLLFGVTMFLEFFITSSTAKAAFIMGILSGVVTSGVLQLSRELLVLIYIFSDGITNIIFPTSPVLLISLSMTGQDYLGWLRRSKYLFLTAFAMALGFLFLGVVLGY